MIIFLYCSNFSVSFKMNIAILTSTPGNTRQTCFGMLKDKHNSQIEIYLEQKQRTDSENSKNLLFLFPATEAAVFRYSFSKSRETATDEPVPA